MSVREIGDFFFRFLKMFLVPEWEHILVWLNYMEIDCHLF